MNSASPTPGIKYDADKLRYDLVPPCALEEVVKVLTYGAKKNAPDNWRHVASSPARYYAAMQRHVQAIAKGETKDPETGFHHYAHAICCLMFAMEHDMGTAKTTKSILQEQPKPTI